MGLCSRFSLNWIKIEHNSLSTGVYLIIILCNKLQLQHIKDETVEIMYLYLKYVAISDKVF